MRALAATLQNHVVVSQSKSVGYERYRTDRKRQEHLLGGQRDIGNAWKAFATPIEFQIFQFQPCQPCFEISGTRYREIDACVAEFGCVAFRIAKRKCAVFCHVPRPDGPADSSCDLLRLWSHRTGSIKQLTAFDYAGSELRQAVGASDEYAIPAKQLGNLHIKDKPPPTRLSGEPTGQTPVL